MISLEMKLRSLLVASLIISSHENRLKKIKINFILIGIKLEVITKIQKVMPNLIRLVV